MKYAFTIPKYGNLTEDFLKKILPCHFDVAKDMESPNDFVLIVSSQQSDQDVLFELQRELDRISFFIGHPVYPLKRCKERDDGFKEMYFTINSNFCCSGKIPDNLGPQVWDSGLAIQLCLWSLSRLEQIPYQAKANLLYQVIEIDAQNQWQKYDDYTVAPIPCVEARLLRNLVSHGRFKGGPCPELKKYCKFLGISEQAHDPTNINEVKIIKGRINIVEKAAEKVIGARISYC